MSNKTEFLNNNESLQNVLNMINDLPDAVKSLDVSMITGVLPIEKGGTDATTKEEALVNLGATPITGGTMTGKLNAYNNATLSDSCVRNISIYPSASIPTSGANGAIVFGYE